MSNAVDLVMVNGPANGRAVCVPVPKMTINYDFIVEGEGIGDVRSQPAEDRRRVVSIRVSRG